MSPQSLAVVALLLLSCSLPSEAGLISDAVLRTYEEAVANCSAQGGVLPTARNEAEVAQLRKVVDQDASSFWLDGREDEDGVYRWQSEPKERIRDDLWYEGHEPWCHKCCRVNIHFGDDVNDGKLFAMNCVFKAAFLCNIAG